MTKRRKLLLLKDLCARLPYGTMIQASEWAIVDTELKFGHIERLMHDEIEIKPYLRPMSEISNLISAKEFTQLSDIDRIDWYNANHIDYRGLLKKGLAIKAPKDMYK